MNAEKPCSLLNKVHRNSVGLKTFFFYLLSFPVLSPLGTSKDYISMLSKYYGLPHELAQEEKS